MCNSLRCDFLCNTILTSNQQNDIKNQFIKKTYQQKRDFILQNTTKVCDNNKNKYSYFLNKNQVCREFFITTLNLKSPQMIVSLYQAIENQKQENEITITAPNDKRGKHIKRKLSDKLNESIIKFINKHKPTPSHYNYERAKLRKYISNHNSISFYTKFANENNFTPKFSYKKVFPLQNSNSSSEICSYEYFKKVLKEKKTFIQSIYY